MTALIRRLLLVPLAAMAVLSAVAACDDGRSTAAAPLDASDDVVLDAALDAAAPDAEPTCNFPGVFGSPVCERCLAGKCCALIAACNSDPSCAPMQQCALSCLPKTDASGCYGECLTKNPAGQTLWQPVFQCWYGEPVDATCRLECTL
jgi:hypothetical protein